MRKNRHFLSIFLLLIPFLSTAQRLTDYHPIDDFLYEADDKSLIRIGRFETIYNIQYTGTYYAYEKKFKKGDIMYNGKLYKNQVINLNSHQDELVLKVPEWHGNIILNKDLVEFFTMEDKSFRSVKEGDIPGLSAGYYEVLHLGKDMVLKKIVKKYKQELDKQELQVKNIFEEVISYYLIKDEKLHEIKRNSAISKLYGVKKREINKYLMSYPDFNRIGKETELYRIMIFIEQR